MDRIFLSLGSNIGDKFMHIALAIEQIKNELGIVKQISPLYETDAWGPVTQETFYNCCVEISSDLSPGKLLSNLLHIESKMGRRRDLKYGPRIIDIDILLLGNKVIHQKKLAVPHPLMQERKFVLVPLADIAGNEKHPTLTRTINELLASCTDPCNVNKLKTSISL